MKSNWISTSNKASEYLILDEEDGLIYLRSLLFCVEPINSEILFVPVTGGVLVGDGLGVVLLFNDRIYQITHSECESLYTRAQVDEIVAKLPDEINEEWARGIGLDQR